MRLQSKKGIVSISRTRPLDPFMTFRIFSGDIFVPALIANWKVWPAIQV
jgi:hypothetical protein